MLSRLFASVPEEVVYPKHKQAKLAVGGKRRNKRKSEINESLLGGIGSAAQKMTGQRLPSLEVCVSRSHKRHKVAKTKTTAKKEAIAGSVDESDTQHWRRHGGEPESKKCCRCHFIREKSNLAREYPWLEPRPSYLGAIGSLDAAFVVG